MRTLFITLPLVVCFDLWEPRSIAATGPLPTGWRSADIGSVGLPGSASALNGTFTVSGAGADIWGRADAFHFTYRTLSGDGSILAEVASVQGAQPWTKVGVMMRASTNAGAAQAMMLISTSKGLAFQRRTSNGGVSTHTSGGSGTAPRWVKLERRGSTITASVSRDGRTWTTVGSDRFSLPSTVLVGLAVSSHDRTRLATGTFEGVRVAARASNKPWAQGRVRVAPNGHVLQYETTGAPFFYLADTGWGLFKRLSRTNVDTYLKDVASKGFNAVHAVLVMGWSNPGAAAHNRYGDHPFVAVNNRYDPARIITTPGNDPADAAAYDYWDHADYILDKAEQYGLYVLLQPTWGNYVSGTTSYARDMSSNIFTTTNARIYGEFVGRRYGKRPNIIWMLGGDRAAVYGDYDFRPVWRRLAEGIGRGVTGQALTWSQPHAAWKQVLMTYQATRRNHPGSSIWFHNDAWLTFNGIQTEYHSIVRKLSTDWKKSPTKPTTIIETRYENDTATDRVVFTGAFKQRYQMYHSILGGSAGYSYGNGRIWDFSTSGKTWTTALNDPGRLAMKTVWQLLNKLSPSELLKRVPDQTLLDGSVGTATAEDLLVAMRGSDRRYAIVYSTNGRNIRLKAAQLATGTADAYFLSPRDGKLYNSAGARVSGKFASITTGAGAAITQFNPPGTAGSGNDWILIVRVR
jgi:regulation of enolase protein 1 (concanavalin A-like superfamily)